MTYKEAWAEQMESLKKSVAYLQERVEATTGSEQARLKAKLEGMKMAYERMVQTEKMYKLTDTEENEE